MAFIANTAFEIKVSNHEFDSIANVTGVYKNGSNNDEVCAAGFLVTKKERLPVEGYVGITNTNTWSMQMATATDKATTPIYACNTFNVNRLTDGVTGAIYKVGTNTLGLAVPAGERSTFTQIYFNNVNIYRFGVGNLSAEISTNQFFTIANGLLVPAATAPAAGLPYFKLLGTGNFTQGAYNGFTYYDVLACVDGWEGGAGA